MNRKPTAGVNRRWHRADLEVSPLAMLTVLAIAVLIAIIAAVA